MKRDRVNGIIDKALVSLLERGIRKFTAVDVQAETIELGYSTEPSRPYINLRLRGYSESDLVNLVANVPMVWEFTESRDRILRNIS